MPEARSCLPYLQLAIMLLLNRYGSMCGYRIASMLNRLGLTVDESAVYTALSKMKRRGLLESEALIKNGRRVVRYKLTGKGRGEMEALFKMYHMISKIVQSIAYDERAGVKLDNVYKPCQTPQQP